MRRGIRTLVIVGVLVAVTGSIVAYRHRDSLPRVWKKVARNGEGAVICIRPGGEPVADDWDGWNQWPSAGRDRRSGENAAAVVSWIRRVGAWAGMQGDPQRVYLPTAIEVERDGARWQLFVREERIPGEDLTDAERELVGRWHYRRGVHDSELELRTDRTGVGSDGSRWRWLSEADRLELGKLSTSSSPSHVTLVWSERLTLAPDRRSWSDPTDSMASGTRVDPPR